MSTGRIRPIRSILLVLLVLLVGVVAACGPGESAGDPHPIEGPGPAGVLPEVDDRPTLRVTVVSEADGSPVPGATLLAWHGASEEVLGTTGRDGVAELGPGDGEAIELIVRAPGHERVQRTLERPEDLVRSGLRIEMADAVVIRGRVASADTKVELANVEVVVTDGYADAGGGHMSSGPALDRARTDAQGRFTVTVPLNRDVTLEVRAEGRIAQTLIHRAGETGEIGVLMPLGGALEGAVLDPDGEPLAGATVWVHSSKARVLRRNPATSWRSDPDGVERARSTTSGANGRWRLEGERADVDLDVFAEAEGYARSEVIENVRADAPATSLSLNVRRLAGVAFDATFEDESLPGRLDVEIRGMTTVRGWAGELRYRDIVDAQLDVGRHLATVTVPHLPELPPVRVWFTTREGEIVRVPVVLRTEPYAEGRVIDDLGAPLAGRSIRIETRDGEPGPSATTDAEGAYLLTKIAGERVNLVVLDDAGGELVRESLSRLPETGRLVVVPRRAALAVRMTVPPGRDPPEDVTLASRDVRVTAPWNGGDLRFEGLPPEYVETRFVVDGYLGPEPEWVSLKPAETRRLDPVELDPGRTLRGRVVDHAGAGVPDADVESSTASATTEADGSFELAPVRRGDVLVEISADGFVAQELTVGDDHPVRVALHPTARIRGVIQVPPGVGAEEFADLLEVRLVDPDRPDEPLETEWPEVDVVSRVVFDVTVPAGRVRIDVAVGEDGPVVASRVINAEPHEIVDVELTPKLP